MKAPPPPEKFHPPEVEINRGIYGFDVPEPPPVSEAELAAELAARAFFRAGGLSAPLEKRQALGELRLQRRLARGFARAGDWKRTVLGVIRAPC